MNRRTFLLAGASALVAPLLPAVAQAAPNRYASDALAVAQRYLGTRYVYGGNDPVNGIDCSAYVSLAWQIPRQSTDTIHNWSYKIAKSELMPGDAMNWPFVGRQSHIRIFAGWATADKQTIWIYEAARGRGVNYRTIAYDDRYTPIRRYNFVADVPQPPTELPPDYDIPGGHFFSQHGDNDGGTGFAITNEKWIDFWSEYLRLGGVKALGYPLTRRFDSHGRVVQVLDKAVLHWDPVERRAELGSPPPDLRTAAPAEARRPERSPLLPG